MEQSTVHRLARILRTLVLVVFVFGLACMLLVPGFAALLADGGPDMVRKAFAASLELPGYEGQGFKSLPVFFVISLWGVWTQLDTALLTLFYWLCGLCVACILWQAKQVLDTILKEEPFQMGNARSLKRAAFACWVISGGATIRLILWMWTEQGPVPLFTYNTLFIPAFFMAGLLFLVMSALFRQAAELKEDQDLTI